MNRPPQLIVVAKLPLRPMHVWAIRVRLQIEGRVRDLALFDIALDSKLRGCDVVALRVPDVLAGGTAATRDRCSAEDWATRSIRNHRAGAALADGVVEASSRRAGRLALPEPFNR